MKTPCSPFETIHGLVYLARMIDKIRIHQAGELSEEYVVNLGIHFDQRCCSLLEIHYQDLVAAVQSGISNEEVWAWIGQHGKIPTDEQIEIWNGFMTKRGWRDAGTETLVRRLKEGGNEHRTDIQTMFDYIDLDEGRPIRPR